ncbi:MAG: hypothetical protein H7A46_13030 [Verrucomicrobiales bacterium]|nr:hypothetical protein [Verrucomicrobiales bacterium]
MYALPSGSDSSWHRSLQISGILFAFGVWLGVVVFGEQEAWFPRFRRALNAVLFAGLAVFGVWLFASPGITLLSSVAVASVVLGYFAEKWLAYLQ